MKKIILATAAAALLASGAATAAPVTYQIDSSHTDVLAQWDHMGFSRPSAHFGQAKGVIRYDEQRPQNSSVRVTLPLAGLNSHVSKLDEHLRTADFFDVGKFPQAEFVSTRVVPAGKGKLHVHGNLTVRGITRPVILHATLNKQGLHPMAKKQAVGFDATAVIKRSDFGMGYAIPMVSDKVQLRITTEALAEK